MKVVAAKNINPANKPATVHHPVTSLSIWLVMVIAVFGCGNDKTEQPRNYPDTDSVQAQLYLIKCGQCHAAPLPSAHTANIWPSVLDRMQMRMKTKNVPPLTREEMSIILGYLQQHAQPSQQLLPQKGGGN